MALDQKLNFDTPPEETISADPDCSICYGRGKMLINLSVASKAEAIPKNLQTINDKTYYEKECACIPRKRERLNRKKHLALLIGMPK